MPSVSALRPVDKVTAIDGITAATVQATDGGTPTLTGAEHSWHAQSPEDVAVALVAGGILTFIVGILGSLLWAAVTAANVPFLLACLPCELGAVLSVALLLLARARFRAAR